MGPKAIVMNRIERVSYINYVDKNSKESILKFHQILLNIAEVI